MTDKILRCATWNIHRAKGRDGRVDPDRIHRVVAEEIASDALYLLALQEADEECRPHGRILDMARIEAETGLVYQHRSSHMRWSSGSDGFLGTILFLHPSFEVTYRDVLDLPGHCHRGAVSIEAAIETKPVRFLSMHLSLSQPLRIVQMRLVGQYLMRRPDMLTVLLGDFNEWRPWGGLMFHPRIVGRRFRGRACRTFPAISPFLPLDRILADRPDAIRNIRTQTSLLIREASDHLPVCAEFTIPAPGEN